MASFTSIFTSLTGAGFFYQKNSRHATYNFNQDGQALYRNQPRFPFEYYINLNLNNVGTASEYISGFFNSPNWQQIAPLVKTVEMPSMKIETTPLNQYNRKRLSQTKIAYEPVKMVFHDVADGKTLKFWDMYYRYYFGDGNEPGQNEAKETQEDDKYYVTEDFIRNVTPDVAGLEGLPSSVRQLFKSNMPTGARSPTSTVGNKSAFQNIVADTIENHRFGFNLPTVQNIRNLIQSIDIYQVHGGRFNQVTLVNPRISAFTHDVLNYAGTEATLELTFTFEYEYAYYTIQNMRLEGEEINNNSSLEPFEHSEHLELPTLAFNASLTDFVESNNPLLNTDNPIMQGIGKNMQSSIGGLTESFSTVDITRRISTSSLNGLVDISPAPDYPDNAVELSARPFDNSGISDSDWYKDVDRVSNTNNEGRWD